MPRRPAAVQSYVFEALILPLTSTFTSNFKLPLSLDAVAPFDDQHVSGDVTGRRGCESAAPSALGRLIRPIGVEADLLRGCVEDAGRQSVSKNLRWR